MKDYQHLRLHEFVNLLESNYDEKVVLELTKYFCLTTTNLEDMRYGMVFLHHCGFYSELDILVNKNKASKAETNQKWAVVFELILDRFFRRAPNYTILTELLQLKVEEPELKAMVYIKIISLYFDIFLYGKLGELLEDLRLIIMHVNNPLLVSLYNSFIDQLLFVFYWKRNEVVLARKYGFKLLNQMDARRTTSHIHINLSLTYIFDDFESSLHHLIEAREIARHYQQHQLLHMIENQNYPFICAHFNRLDQVETDDISEQAHLHLARNNFKQAQQLLSQLTEVTPFTKYYLGRAYQDRKYLLSSYNDFIEKRSDYFFARLPLMVLNNNSQLI